MNTCIRRWNACGRHCRKKSDAFADIVKIGRTHFAGCHAAHARAGNFRLGGDVTETVAMLRGERSKSCTRWPGGTAVGTGLNAPRGFPRRKWRATIAAETGTFVTAVNKFHALTSHDSFVYSHGAVEVLAMNAMKLANDA